MHEEDEQINSSKNNNAASVGRATLQSPPRSQSAEKPDSVCRNTVIMQNGGSKANYSPCSLLKSDSMGASQCVGVQGKYREVSVS